MMRKFEAIEITTSGVDGSATGSATTNKPLNGWIVAVHVDYSAGQPATTDVTITADSPDLTVLEVTNNATDAWYFPEIQANLNTDASAPAGEYVLGVPVDGYVSISVAGANDAETVSVTLMVNG